MHEQYDGPSQGQPQPQQRHARQRFEAQQLERQHQLAREAAGARRDEQQQRDARRQYEQAQREAKQQRALAKQREALRQYELAQHRSAERSPEPRQRKQWPSAQTSERGQQTAQPIHQGSVIEDEPTQSSETPTGPYRPLSTKQARRASRAVPAHDATVRGEAEWDAIRARVELLQREAASERAAVAQRETARRHALERTAARELEEAQRQAEAHELEAARLREAAQQRVHEREAKAEREVQAERLMAEANALELERQAERMVADAQAAERERKDEREHARRVATAARERSQPPKQTQTQARDAALRQSTVRSRAKAPVASIKPPAAPPPVPAAAFARNARNAALTIPPQPTAGSRDTAPPVLLTESHRIRHDGRRSELSARPAQRATSRSPFEQGHATAPRAPAPHAGAPYRAVGARPHPQSEWSATSVQPPAGVPSQASASPHLSSAPSPFLAARPSLRAEADDDLDPSTRHRSAVSRFAPALAVLLTVAAGAYWAADRYLLRTGPAPTITSAPPAQGGTPSTAQQPAAATPVTSPVEPLASPPEQMPAPSEGDDSQGSASVRDDAEEEDSLSAREQEGRLSLEERRLAHEQRVEARRERRRLARLEKDDTAEEGASKRAAERDSASSASSSSARSGATPARVSASDVSSTRTSSASSRADAGPSKTRSPTRAGATTAAPAGKKPTTLDDYLDRVGSPKKGSSEPESEADRELDALLKQSIKSGK